MSTEEQVPVARNWLVWLKRRKQYVPKYRMLFPAPVTWAAAQREAARHWKQCELEAADHDSTA